MYNVQWGPSVYQVMLWCKPEVCSWGPVCFVCCLHAQWPGVMPTENNAAQPPKVTPCTLEWQKGQVVGE